MSSLLACPFCRELYGADEADTCQVCGVQLKALPDLPPSFEARQRAAAQWAETHPDDRCVAFTDLRRGRGVLLALSVLGLGAFFAPWLSITQPYDLSLSGFQLAGSRGYWFAGGALGWFLNLPLVASRRTISRMRGARVIVTLFAGLTACQALLLWWLAPTSSFVPLQYEWDWGFFASAVLSLIGAIWGCRFGGAKTAEPAPAQPTLAPAHDQSVH